MKLVNEIVDLLSDEKTSTQSGLLKAQILGHRLGDAQLSKWVEHELRGYSSESEVPPYRVLTLTLVGHVTNGVYHYSNQTLATGHLDEDARSALTRAEVRESVSAIESWADKNNVARVVPAEALHMLSKNLSETYFVQQAWGKFSAGAIDQILIQVRSRLLEFCLRIADQLPAELSSDQLRRKAEEMSASEIFRNAVFGDNATIVVGGGSIQDVRNAVVQNDLDSLLKYLKDRGVREDDLLELKSAVANDASTDEVKAKTLGPRVRSWIGGMISKAGSAAWGISMGAAGNTLGTALSAYYGIGH